MRRLLRTAATWVLRGLLVLLGLVALDVAALAFPYPAFPYRKGFGALTVYSDHPIPDGFEQVADEALARVAAIEDARHGEGHRVFICGDERLYAAFAFLTRKSSDSMAIGLSLVRNIYVNEPKILRVAAHNVLGIRHSRFEGNLAEAIAHEVAHWAVVGKLGLRAANGLPVWKSEGYAEYQANAATTRRDDSYVFIDRVALLLDDDKWTGSPTSRRLFEWHVLVEFLAEKQGMDLDALADERVTETSAREQLLAWYRHRQDDR